LIQDPKEFLDHEDRNALRLSGPAAIEACLRAEQAGLAIGRIEGGQWLNPGIMARLDSIWATRRRAINSEEARQRNLSAAKFIEEQLRESPDPALPAADVFIITAYPFAYENSE